VDKVVELSPTLALNDEMKHKKKGLHMAIFFHERIHQIRTGYGMILSRGTSG